MLNTSTKDCLQCRISPVSLCGRDSCWSPAAHWPCGQSLVSIFAWSWWLGTWVSPWLWFHEFICFIVFNFNSLFIFIHFIHWFHMIHMIYWFYWFHWLHCVVWSLCILCCCHVIQVGLFISKKSEAFIWAEAVYRPVLWMLGQCRSHCVAWFPKTASKFHILRGIWTWRLLSHHPLQRSLNQRPVNNWTTWRCSSQTSQWSVLFLGGYVVLFYIFYYFDIFCMFHNFYMFIVLFVLVVLHFLCFYILYIIYIYYIYIIYIIYMYIHVIMWLDCFVFCILWFIDFIVSSIFNLNWYMFFQFYDTSHLFHYLFLHLFHLNQWWLHVSWKVTDDPLIMQWMQELELHEAWAGMRSLGSLSKARQVRILFLAKIVSNFQYVYIFLIIWFICVSKWVNLIYHYIIYIWYVDIVDAVLMVLMFYVYIWYMLINLIMSSVFHFTMFDIFDICLWHYLFCGWCVCVCWCFCLDGFIFLITCCCSYPENTQQKPGSRSWLADTTHGRLPELGKIPPHWTCGGKAILMPQSSMMRRSSALSMHSGRTKAEDSHGQSPDVILDILASPHDVIKWSMPFHWFVDFAGPVLHNVEYVDNVAYFYFFFNILNILINHGLGYWYIGYFHWWAWFVWFTDSFNLDILDSPAWHMIQCTIRGLSDLCAMKCKGCAIPPWPFGQSLAGFDWTWNSWN